MRRAAAPDRSGTGPLSHGAAAAVALVVVAAALVQALAPQRGGLLLLVGVAAVAVPLVRRCRSLPSERGAWGAFAAGTALLVLSAPAAAEALAPSAGPSPLAGPFGLLGLLAYPFVFHGHLVVLRRRRTMVVGNLDGWLDGASSVLVHAAVCAWLLVPPLRDRGADLVTAWTTAFLPVVCLVLTCTAVANCVLTGWRRDTRLPLLAATTGLVLVGSVLDLLAAAGPTPVDLAAALSTGLRAGALAVLVVTLHRAPTTDAHRPTTHTGWAPLLASVTVHTVAVVLVVAAQLRPAPAESVVLAGAALLVVGVKTALIFSELLSLVESRRLSLTDDVTGLPNRRAFFAALADLSAGAPRDVHVVLVDLDRFKAVNDLQGHHTGDLLLADVGERLRAAVGPEVLAARLGGDEFAVLLPDASPAAAEACAARVVSALGPRRVGGTFFDVGASAGVARGTLGSRPADPTRAGKRVRGTAAGASTRSDGRGEDLLRAADTAMYAAKADGGGTHRLAHRVA